MRNAPNEYYHIYNRGMQKQPIFDNDNDRLRLLFLLLTFQGKCVIKNISRIIKQGVQHRVLHIPQDIIKEVKENRTVELIAFAFMSNHFHIIVREIEQSGISNYMQRVLDGYTKYFNVRYNKSGHLFQGPYQGVHIGNDEQLMHVSAYIHKNPLELNVDIEVYTWSSYQDYTRFNRWEGLLITDPILARYESNFEYKNFVYSSVAKEQLNK